HVLTSSTCLYYYVHYFFFSTILRPPTSTLFPYTTLFRSAPVNAENGYDEEEDGPNNTYQDSGHSHWHNSLIWADSAHDISILGQDRKSTRLNSSHRTISYAVFCLKKKKKKQKNKYTNKKR